MKNIPFGEIASDILYATLVKPISGFFNVPVYLEDTQFEHGPVVFVANHFGAKGPLYFVFSVKTRVHPWVISEITNFSESSEYIRRDFVEPVLGISAPASNIVSYGISLISVPFISSLIPVPVFRRNTYGTLDDTFALSFSLLKESRNLLVFPEDPDGDVIDIVSGIRRFMKGFTRLAEKLYDDTGIILKFYPTAIWERGIHVGSPVSYNPDTEHRNKERLRILHTLEQEVIRMYNEK